ncbi:hypothetical protein MNAN1_003591 [Malassezia nana]|uniref:Potassium transport protein n=1 Tax=Malassezia nana TaxID=180528 RepID=A0AAF0EQ32_9BASI|nr:hypothetical protein MNAN1_003591 [Malassezia nana]
MGMFWSAMLYASNTKDNYVPYIDCLFFAFSAITMTGLVTYPASQLSVWQQVILVFLIFSGNLVIVSTTTVLVRRHFFRKQFDKELERSKTMQAQVKDIEEKRHQERVAERSRVRRWFGGGEAASPGDAHQENEPGKSKTHPKLHAGMIQRVQGPAVQVNPTGQRTTMVEHPVAAADAPLPGILQTSSSVPNEQADTVHVDLPTEGGRHVRSHTVPVMEHAEPELETASLPVHAHTMVTEERDMSDDEERYLPAHFRSIPGAALHRTLTVKRDTGLGGFPSLWDYFFSLLHVSRVRERLTVPAVRTMTTMQPETDLEEADNGRQFAPYLTFDATVTGNSHFRNLTAAQRNELGGVEYRALNMLAWLIPAYWFTCVSVVILLIAPYMSSPAGAAYRETLTEQAKPPHNPTWWSIFATVSAIGNAGILITDNSLAGGLTSSYIVILSLMALIMIGNTGFPIMLRFVIWVLSLCVPRRSRTYETLRFLLDHPRRCFLYLFPSENTWFLAFVLLTLNLFDWLILMVCDLDLRHKFTSNGTWVLASLFQAVSTRTCGMQTLAVLDLAPAEQLLEVLMMYIAAFPIMMTVRSTNVYEDRSVFVAENEDTEDGFESPEGRVVWGRFLSVHMRKQLAYDLWWLILVIWIVCLAEKSKIDSDQFSSMTIFNIVYEEVSAYGTVGLSTGASNGKPTSLVGDMTVLSKLVTIAVMIRGRHRNLPNAIDRAVMLPRNVARHDTQQDQPRRASTSDDMLARTSSRMSRRTSTLRRTATQASAAAPALDEARPMRASPESL